MASQKQVKRLIVACDGTWVNSDNGLVYTTGKLAVPSNVTRICRALLPRAEDGTSQIVFYQGGLGSSNNWWSYYAGGYLGDGISDNIREAYAFLCNNYEDGDEIYLIGFSRGAFTARSVGGLIASIGLLNKSGLGSFYPIFKDWENQLTRGYKPNLGSKAWPVENRPRFSRKDTKYLDELVKKGLTRAAIPVRAIAVWDTVGSLGVPSFKSPYFNIPMYTQTSKEYSFIDTEVAPNVDYAYQALALDEQRTPFSPTVWESPKPGSKVALKELKQTWFPGVHSSIGGGYTDTSISDITLAWMMTQLQKHLTFDQSYISAQRTEHVDFYQSASKPVKEWALGLLKRSDTGLLNTMMGRSVRTPGQYNRINPLTEKETDHELVKTCEFIHPSVRWRWRVRQGTGLVESEDDTDPKTTYIPAALKDWDFHEPGALDEAEYGQYSQLKPWQEYGKWTKKDKDGRLTFIIEEKIEDDTVEGELLHAWPGVREELYAGGYRD